MRGFSGMALACVSLALGVGSATADYTNTTIYDVQQNVHGINDSVRVTNVVVIGVDVRPPTFGVYIQEQASGPFSGVLAYRSGTFPAYENSADPVAVGDVIDCEGLVSDFNGLAELINPLLYKQGTTTPLAPEVLPPDSLTTLYGGAERWEGVLVQVQNVVITSNNQFNQWFIHNAAGTDSLSGYEKMISGQVIPQAGDTLSSVTGVADWAFSERRIAPRDNDDIIFASQGPAPFPNLAYASDENKVKVRFNVPLDPTTAQTTTNYSLSSFENITLASYDDPSKTVTLTTATNLVPSTTPHTLAINGVRNAENRLMDGTQNISFIGGIATIPFIQDPISASNDTSKVNGQQVSFRGVVTAVGNDTDFPSGFGFYVQQRGITEHAGMFVFGAPTTPARNDSVFVSGVVQEFGIGPETEITGVDEVTILASGVTPIAPIDRTLAQISGSNLGEAEKYESALVRVLGVTVITSNFQGQPFDVTGPDTVRVDDLAVDEGTYQPLYEDVLDVTGIIRFSGSVPYRRLQPRNWNEPPTGDIHIVTKSTVSDAPNARWATNLLQNNPNPFNPTTRIEYSIGSPGRASLRIFDLRGRLVATLFDAHRGVGPGHVVWDGRDDSGTRTPSGVYWYRLTTAAGEERARKMVLLK